MADIQAQMTVCLESRENTFERRYINLCIMCLEKGTPIGL